MFGKIKYLFKLTLAYTNRFKGVILISTLVGVLLFFLIPKIYPIFNIKQERIGLTGRYHTDELPQDILSGIGQGLTEVDEKGNVVPGLAKTWVTPDQGKTWVFKLAEGKYWHDGGKVVSQDIKYQFNDVEVERPDAETLVYKLKEPFSPFPSVVSRPVFKKGLVGTGVWQVKKLRLSGSYVQEILLVNKDKNRLIYRFYPTLERTKTAFKLGQVDKLVNIMEPSEFATWPNVNIVGVSNKNQVVTLFFNTQDQFLGDKSARQALTYAIDKSTMGDRALTPISSSSWAYNPQVKEYAYDLNHSKEILKDLPQELKSSRIRLISTQELLPVAEKISKDWTAVGIGTTVVISPYVPSEFQAFLTILDLPKDPDQYPLWHSTQTDTNISGYNSARVDKLLEEGRRELNPDERRRIYFDFQRFLLEDLPAVFLYNPTYYTISRK